MQNFNWHQPPFMLAPYAGGKGLYAADTLVTLYYRLKQEDLYDTVFHDNPDMDLYGFMNFFSTPSVMLSLCSLVEGEQVQDIAGMAWLVGPEQFGTRKRGLGSFVSFRDYHQPALTDQMGRMVLQYWLDYLGTDVVVGMTPAENQLAVRFIKRLGFEELFRMPEYSNFRGRICDTVVTRMTKEQYHNLYGGQNGKR